MFKNGYLLKNALISIIRNKGRNILIAIIIAVISAACAVTLSIRNSATKIVTAYEEKYSVEATIGTNRDTLMQSFKESSSTEDRIDMFNNINSLTLEEIKNYGDSSYVSSYYYIYSLNMDADGLEEAKDNLMKETTTIEEETNTTIKEIPNDNFGPNGGGSQQSSTTTNRKTTTQTEIINTTNGAFTVQGYSSYESMTDFISGNYTIVEGEVSSDFTSNSCVISEELATLNEISVGDTITLVSPENTDVTYELTVTGIYTENTNDAASMDNMYTASANTIITNSTVIETILESDSSLTATITPTYILTSKDVVEAFTQEVTDKGLSEYYTLSDNVDTVESATKSIVNVKTFATTFLIITLIIGGVVLFVLNMINIRERKYEIGVLRTIGMNKSLLIIQFMTELLIVCIFGLIIGAGIGSLCSVKVANNLLANEIDNATKEVETINNNFGGSMGKENQNIKNNDQNKDFKEQTNNINGLVNIEQVSDMNAIVDLQVLLQLLAIGLALTAISSLSACIAIARFSPLTILKERS